MALTRKVVLCADDYGLTAGVSRGILQLARSGRISATSCMTNLPGWPRAAADLREVAARIGVGLHLNLTSGASATKMLHGSLSDLMQRAFTGRLVSSELRVEIARQLDLFEQALGRRPDFVDGHQHVHVLPAVRSALLQVLAERGYAGKIWLRDPSDDVLSIVRRGVAANKALLVKALALGFRRDARAAGFATNQGFSGFSAFEVPEVGATFEASLADLGPKPLVMCHPGEADDELRALDSVVESRPAELAYLASPAFAELLRSRGLALTPAPAK